MSDVVASISLSELCSLIDDTLKVSFHNRAWWVLAEIKERTERGETIYLELVQKGERHDVIARLSASVWRKEAIYAFRNFEDLTGKRPDKGIQVLLKVGVQFHPVYGVSVQVFDIDSTHMLGQLELMRRETIKQLAARPYIRLVDEELRTPNKALILAPVIKRIAIITSPSAAGYEDFKHTLASNPYGYRFQTLSYYAMVQGEQAAVQMKDQLVKIFEEVQAGRTFDTVVIVRGGGAQSDLLPFDQFVLAQAVAKFPIPVITGIGHLKNESVVDMVAHSPLKTPTQVAEFIIDHNRDYEETMEGLAFRVFQSAKERLHAEEIRIQHHGIAVTQGTVQLLHVASNRLSRLRERINWSSQRLTADANRKLDDQFKLIKDSVSRRLERQQHQLLVIEAQMKNASPEKILSRGFAWLTAGEEILTSVHQLQPQTAITAHLKDGTAQLNVVQINKSQRDE